MSFHTANGSKVKIGGVSLECKMTRLRKASRLTENTHSGTSSSNFEAVVNDHSWSISVPWDDTNIPDTGFGLAVGNKVTLIFTMGDTAKTETLTNTSVESVEDIFDNAGDIIRSEITGKGGVLTPAS